MLQKLANHLLPFSFPLRDELAKLVNRDNLFAYEDLVFKIYLIMYAEFEPIYLTKFL